MADPYAKTRSVLKLEIIERVGAGEPLRALDRAPGLPSMVTVWKWRRADPWFDGEMAAALRRGAWRRTWMVDEAKAKELLARRRAGEPIARILRDPRMPSRKVFDYWRATDVWFAGEIASIIADSKAWRMRGLRKVSVRTPFDRDVADAIIQRMARGETLAAICRDPKMPCNEVIERWRREDEEFGAGLAVAMRVRNNKHGRSRKTCEALTDAILGHIVQGESLESLSKLPGMPHATTLRRWRRRWPDFADRVDQACADREHWYADHILEIAETVVPGQVKATRKRMAPLGRRLGQVNSGRTRMRRR